MNDFDGLAAIVSGAGSGIGQATAAELAERGARVAGLDVEPDGIPEGVLALKADLTSQQEVDVAVAEAVGAYGRLDVLVNNAGIGATGTVEDNDDAEWLRVYDVNVLSMVRMARATLPHLRRSPSAAVVNVASLYATTGMPKRACYSASKGAVMALSLAMAADLAAERIRVNCVCPGSTDTPWVRRLLAGAPDPDRARAEGAARLPLGRRGEPEELAYAIAFCASPRNANMTGAVIGVDGGMSTLRLPVNS
ncbi:short-chain dehydrogenase [Actinomadura sp. NBRC 104412]|uniref:SDR family NAD(P)-dependent oxidoreductase n=1 Tax=Actinomadura sp. NBRC 104412 TaxID=3032203 RepID=UPI00249FFC0E|nr:SDR family oxidoreductase [Actinomadura sp. NBRC 104412]GLZ07520.1 short-chain dehydrogenase [Actinomadura sp. NBRC 104412]